MKERLVNPIGAALQPERVVQAQIDYLRTEATHGGYGFLTLISQTFLVA